MHINSSGPLRGDVEPSFRGVDTDGIHTFLDAAEARQLELHSMLVLRHSRVVAEGWWSPYSPDLRHMLYSLSKIFVSTAAGLAVAEGLLSMDEPVARHFPEVGREIDDSRSARILVRHVASMTSGHLDDTWGRAVAADPAEPARGFLRLEPEREPGTVFCYDQSAAFVLASLVQRASGQLLTDYLHRRLLIPLGIDEGMVWELYSRERVFGFTGGYATTSALARIGQLHLQKGWWQGRQLLPDGWVAEATGSQVPTAGRLGPDWRQGYGFQFWLSRHGFRGDGTYGQFCLVLPEQEAVVALTGATGNMQAVLDAVWRHLVPALSVSGTTAPSTTARAALQRRLAALRLPTSHTAPVPPSGQGEWDGAVFTPSGSICRDQPSLRRVTLRRAARDAASAWYVTLSEPGCDLTLGLGTDDWLTSDTSARSGAGAVPTAVHGGWSDASTLTIQVIFLETPHRLVLSCSLRDRSFTARWHTAPLRPVLLRMLRAPAN
jgi:CubicO group peptidase (beta-lactamase class C family)